MSRTYSPASTSHAPTPPTSLPPPPRSTLFPYTTLFRSPVGRQQPGALAREVDARLPAEAEAVDPILQPLRLRPADGDRKSTRLNSSHVSISYAVFCLKKKKKKKP